MKTFHRLLRKFFGSTASTNVKKIWSGTDNENQDFTELSRRDAPVNINKVDGYFRICLHLLKFFLNKNCVFCAVEIAECSGKENSVLMFFFYNQNINSLPKYDIRAVGHLILLGLKNTNLWHSVEVLMLWARSSYGLSLSINWNKT